MPTKSYIFKELFVIFKIGFFVFMCGIVIPIYSGAHFILWDSKYMEALKQYWINKIENKPLNALMISAHLHYLSLRYCGFAAASGLFLMLVGYFWEL